MYRKVQKVKVPFKGTLFDIIKRCLRRYNMVPIAKIRDKLSCFVKKGKDQTKKLDYVNLVYNIPCATCKLSYVGETTRIVI